MIHQIVVQDRTTDTALKKILEVTLKQILSLDFFFLISNGSHIF